MQTDRLSGSAATAAERVTAGRPAIRVLATATAVAMLALLGLGGSAPARAAGNDSGTNGTGTQALTAQGTEPLTASDKDLLVKVRLAGLWEMPAGQMAATKGVNPRVREVGAMISAQHGRLDALVVAAAGKVGVALPNEPNADQQKWLGEMRAASGTQFDQVFVDRLRAAHGKVFPAIANVRSGTRNTVVRTLAQQANGFVLTHLTLLESTGLVDYNGLPAAPSPSAAAAPAGSAATSAASTGGPMAALASMVGAPEWFLWTAVAAAVLMGAFSVVRMVQRRRWDEDDDDDEIVPVSRSASRPASPPVPPPPPPGSYGTAGMPSPYQPQVQYDDSRLRTTPRFRP